MKLKVKSESEVVQRVYSRILLNLKLAADTPGLEMTHNTCTYCGQNILLQIRKGTSHCSQICEERHAADSSQTREDDVYSQPNHPTHQE